MEIRLNCCMCHNATHKPLLASADFISLVAEWYVNGKKKLTGENDRCKCGEYLLKREKLNSTNSNKCFAGVSVKNITAWGFCVYSQEK